jgi:hypothetical protein
MGEVIRADIINVWSSESAPERLRKLLPPDVEWVALVPGPFVSPATEGIFLRWHSDAHPVTRQVLGTGAVVFGGSHPNAQTMLGHPGPSSWKRAVAAAQRGSTT